MTRLDAWGKHNKIEYPEDVARLKEGIPELADIPDAQIQDMYAFWSEAHYCASWLIMNADTCAQFQEWILSESDDNAHYCTC